MNQNGLVKGKLVLLISMIVILVGTVAFFSFYYPIPSQQLSVASIGGAERASKYRNVKESKIQLDESQINQFFQSAEWQNLSKDPETLKLLQNEEVMDQVSSLVVLSQGIEICNIVKEANNKQAFKDIEDMKYFLLKAFMNSDDIKVNHYFLLNYLVANQKFDLWAVLTWNTFLNNSNEASMKMFASDMLNLVGLVNNQLSDEFKNTLNQQVYEAVFTNTDLLKAGFTNVEMLKFFFNNPEMQKLVNAQAMGLILNKDFQAVMASNIFSKIVFTQLINNQAMNFVFSQERQ